MEAIEHERMAGRSSVKGDLLRLRLLALTYEAVQTVGLKTGKSLLATQT
jgi:hypothetical protein